MTGGRGGQRELYRKNLRTFFRRIGGETGPELKTRSKDKSIENASNGIARKKNINCGKVERLSISRGLVCVWGKRKNGLGTETLREVWQ